MLQRYLPPGSEQWLGTIETALSITAIVAAAAVLRAVVKNTLVKAGRRYKFPLPVEILARRISSVLIWATAVLLVLDQIGVSAKVLWAAFSGFAAVGAVAFFAAWSVLSNIFCTLLIFATTPFRIGDYIELLENGEKPGYKGRVIDVNLIYTTLEESAGQGHTVMQIPNSLFFQRTVRRWLPNANLEMPPRINLEESKDASK